MEESGKSGALGQMKGFACHSSMMLTSRDGWWLQIPTRTVVQIRTHAQKYFQKLAKGNAAANKEEAPRRGRPRKKTARPSSLAVPSAGGRAVKKPRGFNDSTQPHLLIRHRSYVGRSENPIASSVPASVGRVCSSMCRAYGQANVDVCASPVVFVHTHRLVKRLLPLALNRPRLVPCALP